MENKKVFLKLDDLFPPNRMQIQSSVKPVDKPYRRTTFSWGMTLGLLVIALGLISLWILK